MDHIPSFNVCAEDLPMHKIVGLVVYMLAHGYFAKFMTNLFCVCASTVQ